MAILRFFTMQINQHTSRSSIAMQPSSRVHTCSTPCLGRRRMCVSLLVMPGLLTQLFGDEAAPQYGDCPTCVGPSSEALGSCAGLSACISSYDDRPAHFVTPWEFEDSQSEAMSSLQRALRQLGANIELQQADYLYASLPARGLGGSTIDVEFLCAKSDKTVAIRAATRRASLPDAGSCYKAIEEVRRRLGWEEVPVLRNRKQPFGLSTPWDSFGPETPLDWDYRELR